MQIFLNQFIMHYLNNTLTMLASYGDKILAQLTLPTFSRKRHLELSILKSIMLTPLLCFTLKLSKLQIKSRLRTVSFYKQIYIPTINYLQFLLIGLHFHQCLTIIKHCLPVKETFKSLLSKQRMEKMLLFLVIRAWNDI